MSMTAALLAGRVSAGLGVARWSRWLVTMGVVLAIGLGVGAWGGSRWERGTRALSDLKTERDALKTQREETNRVLGALRASRQDAVDAATEYRNAALRLETIANEYALKDQARLRAFDAALERQRTPLLDARRDLWACDIGRGLLDHWNSAARGPAAAGADAAAAGDPGAAAGAVRADAGGDRQPRAGADRAARPGDGRAP